MLVVNLLIAAAVAVIAILTSRAADWHPLSLVAVLGAFSVASELMDFRITRGSLQAWCVTSTAPLALCIALLGPAPSVAIGAVGLAATAAKNRKPFPDVAANYANYGVCLLIGGLLCRWTAESLGLSAADGGFALLVMGAYAFIFIGTFLFNGSYNRIGYGDPVREQWQNEGSRLLAESPTLLLAGGTAYVYGNLGLGALGLLVVVQLMYQYFTRNLLLSEERALVLQQRADELAALHGTLTEQAKHLSELSESRGRLVGQVLQAEEGDRRRLAEALHDEALQEMLSARHGLNADDGGNDRARESIARAIEQLRGTIFDLHPAVLEHAGLSAALHEVADRHEGRTGFRPQIEVAPEACGPHDALLFVLGREQLTNAVKHSKATEIELVIDRIDHKVVMEVHDNGLGMDSERRRTALERGHIGLASSAERVEALGGRLEIDSRRGHGTRIRTTLPLRSS
jgi:signal transduction histidine kinase